MVERKRAGSEGGLSRNDEDLAEDRARCRSTRPPRWNEKGHHHHHSMAYIAIAQRRARRVD